VAGDAANNGKVGGQPVDMSTSLKAGNGAGGLTVPMPGLITMLAAVALCRWCVCWLYASALHLLIGNRSDVIMTALLSAVANTSSVMLHGCL
jgi:hypothetical protein